MQCIRSSWNRSFPELTGKKFLDKYEAFRKPGADFPESMDKASLLKQWKMQFAAELNGGSFTAEYRYDGGPFRKIRLAEWETVPEDAEYLFFRFRMKRAETSGLSPFVHNLELFVREK